jgi:hypothetical protein
MVAANPLDYIYDSESYANVFTLGAKHPVSGSRWRFEYSHRVNQIPALIDWLTALRSGNSRMVGFNNVSFDYPVLHYILNNPGVTPWEINQFVQRIINAGHSNRFDHIIWDRERYVEQIDLYKIHHFDNKARATSLKVLEFNMRSDSIQDLPFVPGSTLTDNQIDELLSYQDHDVDKTEEFYYHTLPAIRFREELSVKYGRNFLNDNDTKIGKQYFIMRLEQDAPGSCYEKVNGRRKMRQTNRQYVALADVIFPWIQFKRPEFTAVKDWFATQVITKDQFDEITAEEAGEESHLTTKGLFIKIPLAQLGSLGQYAKLHTVKKTGVTTAKKLNCVVDGFQFDFGTGGIHGSVTNRSIYSDTEYVIRDIDVTSYYPCLGIKNRAYPLHLGEGFCNIYSDVFDMRAAFTKGTPENAMLKLALNGVYGDSNNKYSPFYDPQYTMTITVNGQLLLCLLADYLMDIPGLEMIQVNTDGVTVRLPRAAVERLDAICEWWQSHTLLTLEHVDYAAMHIRDGNSYLAVKPDGKLKRKGAYEWETTQAGGTLGWHQNHSALVIPMAAEAALVHGESVREYVMNHDNLWDFMLRTKVPRTSRLVLEQGGTVTPCQNITRYYISKHGGSLVKIMPPLPKKPGVERRIGVACGWQVQPCNEIQGVKGTDINMEYYIAEAEKLVRPLRGGG